MPEKPPKEKPETSLAVAPDDTIETQGPFPASANIIDRSFQSGKLLLDTVRYFVTGAPPDTWFGPNQPRFPTAQKEKGRTWDYPVGYNMRTVPRGEENVSFQELRALADNLPLLRLAIETRKDQLAKMPWDIKFKAVNKEVDAAMDPAVQQIKRLLEFPDREHTFRTWQRLILEDMLVIDAASIEPRFSFDGTVVGFDVIDGGTIKRLIQRNGRTPEPPDPAYIQVLHGVSAIDLSADQLVYFPRNLRTNRVYGMSPVEQIILLANIALRRELHKLEWYTEGSIPDAFAEVPEGWGLDQLKQFQEWFDGLLSGNTKSRRKVRFMPSLKGMVFPKAEILKDQYDEWLARLICYAFSLPPTALVGTVNKATGETMREQADSEGLIPLMAWWKDLMDILIGKYLGRPDLEFAWREDPAGTPLEQAQTNQILVSARIKTIDEVRVDMGLEPLGGEFALPSALPEPFDPNADPEAKDEKDPDQKVSKLRKLEAVRLLRKQRKKVLRRRRNPALAPATKKLTAYLTRFLKKEGRRIGKEVSEKIPVGLLHKVVNPLADEVDRILSAVELKGWTVLIDPMESAMKVVGKFGVKTVLGQLGINDKDIFDVANQGVVDYAKGHAAEMVGMRRLPSGALVQNPNPSWRIDEATREALGSDVTFAIEEGLTRSELADLISRNYAFSAQRAETIAHTELSLANANADREGWTASGVVKGKVWLISADHEGKDVCDDCHDAGEVPLDAEFADGITMEPAHPNCWCTVVAIVDEDADVKPSEIIDEADVEP